MNNTFHIDLLIKIRIESFDDNKHESDLILTCERDVFIIVFGEFC